MKRKTTASQAENEAWIARARAILKEAKHRPQKEASAAGRALCAVIFGICFAFGALLVTLGLWYQKTFDLEFKELLYTLASPLKGTGGATVLEIVGVLLPIGLIAIALYIAVAILLRRCHRALRFLFRAICVGMLAFSVVFAMDAFRIPAYFQALRDKTTIYEDWYVDPDTVSITADEKPKNLIYIYLESMETTYASAAEGGVQSENYIPGLTEMAEENISFSDKLGGMLGGFHTPIGTGWTIAAMLATSSGIPFAFPVGENGHNSMSSREHFAAGLTTLGDVLEQKGYRQEFLCGSKASFAGRDTYLREHGNFEIFDLYTAREEGYIPKDYYEWWGYEDAILYEIAKDELTELAAGDRPFNFTMLTVDTHHVGGYTCTLCESEYASKTANVVACADRQITAFVEWCTEQDFFEDTVIVITGDHMRMDKRLVDGVDEYDRTIYNCFIGSAVEPRGLVSEREFTSFDLFPTTLAAMGFSIEGERLGLGVNLFSDQPTLAERLGYDYLNAEVQKFSDYYIRHFS